MTLLDSFLAPRPSVEERLAAGKRLRAKLPRSAQAQYTKAANRPDPVAVIEEQSAGRLPQYVPERYKRMLATPFGFFRGAAAIMTNDLSRTRVTGLTLVACGDMHVANIGVFASAERNLVFAINDFDEAHYGPWEWDLKRLATSAAIATDFLGGDRDLCARAALLIAQSYRLHMQQYAQMGYLQVWYDRIDPQAILDGLPPDDGGPARALVRKARANGSIRALDKLTELVDGKTRIIENPPQIVRERGADIEQGLGAMLREYIASLPDDRKGLLARYRIVDWARKVVGVGSVGLNCWIVFLQGMDDGDPLFLQVKEARPSVLAPYVPIKHPFTNEGQRVVTGQRIIQGSPDILLGWGRVGDRDFYVRQLADMKGGPKFVQGDTNRLASLEGYSNLCGWALALAHSKSGDPALIAGYCGSSSTLDQAITEFAMSYMKQNRQDYAALAKAQKTGRIQAAK